MPPLSDSYGQPEKMAKIEIAGPGASHEKGGQTTAFFAV
jgi:hypothetical protein